MTARDPIFSDRVFCGYVFPSINRGWCYAGGAQHSTVMCAIRAVRLAIQRMTHNMVRRRNLDYWITKRMVRMTHNMVRRRWRTP